MKLARRAEVLRQIIEDRSRIVEALVRELASLYVPSPRNWIDARWSCGHSEIREARRASLTRFRYLDQTRQRDETLALPPPKPGQGQCENTEQPPLSSSPERGRSRTRMPFNDARTG